MKTPRSYDAGSVASHDLFAPFENWGNKGTSEYFGLCMDGQTILDGSKLEENDDYTREWHLTYYGGGIWEIEYSDAPELCTIVFRGKLPTREAFLSVMRHVENAPSWANH